ncbi:S-adenosyl-L-methionine-dependent methyltransferase [Periconia macrospinosa]|uniref:S-adenosyl-L-methionine-dependent methyltransferase n=1 Tax=Periconia macrospinosa TaxID=97972 RepID=A0A2V1DB36_9PLEO|nr:S-adenosyl-L-methionine-dependent methyltransferase [Periconia macrospinosa]
MSNQDINNARFDAEAATWDADEKHLDGVEKAFEAIKRHVPAFQDGSAKDLDVLEIGCGTGLLSFKLAPHVRSLIGVDTSDGMLASFNSKIASLPDPSTANVAAVNVLVRDPDDFHLQGAASALAVRRGESGKDTPYRFDLVVSHLTLHHIEDMGGLMRILFSSLKSGGRVALTDYEDFGEDAKAFHPKAKWAGVERHGVKKQEIEDVIDGVGFNEVKIERPFSLNKQVEGVDGGDARYMDFPFLLCLGQKS